MILGENVTHKAVIKRFTTLEEDFKQIHGDTYDYSKVIYYGGKTKIDIICKIHGIFSIRTDGHLNGNGCVKCGYIRMGQVSKIAKAIQNKKNFLINAERKHGVKYNYTNMFFQNMNTDIQIICPIHGEFNQTPKNHLKGTGCRGCGKEQRLTKAHNRTLKSWSKFMLLAPIIHNNKYTYDINYYTSINTKMKMFCQKHGSFSVAPAVHLLGVSCAQCATEDKSIYIRNAGREKFREAVKSKYDHLFIPDFTTYNTINTKMVSRCLTFDFDFSQYPRELLKGVCCRYCSKIQNQLMMTNSKTCLYYISITSTVGTFYKIGITSKKLSRRFCGDNFFGTIKVIHQSKYTDRKTVLLVEQKILLDHKDNLLHNIELLKAGNDEIFKLDILPKHYFKDIV